jgi:predicted DCC family thiol-disulfide oxidoreductase YuxK
VILYDGVCVFCSRWMRFIAARDTNKRFRLVRVLRAFPKPLRDTVYNLVARNRHRIFGKYEACFVPDAGVKARVME